MRCRRQLRALQSHRGTFEDCLPATKAGNGKGGQADIGKTMNTSFGRIALNDLLGKTVGGGGASGGRCPVDSNLHVPTCGGHCKTLNKLQNHLRMIHSCIIYKLTRLCIRETGPLDVYRRISELPCWPMVRRAGYLWQCPGAGWQNTLNTHCEGTHACILAGTHGHDLPQRSSIRMWPAGLWPTDLMHCMSG